MNIVSISLLFLLLQAIFNIIKIVLEDLFLDEDIAHYGEIIVSLLLGIIYYFSLLSYNCSPIVSWFSASLYGIFAVIISWSLPQISGTIFGWGEESIPLPISFALFNAWVLFLCFLPSGLGTTIGVPTLFSGKIIFFFVIIFAQLVTTCLILFISHYFEDETATLAIDVMLCQGMAILIWTLLINQMPRGQATFLTMIILVATTIEMIGLYYFAMRYLEIFEIDENFWKQRRYILLSQVGIIAIVYIFPLIRTFFSFIDSLVS